MNIVLSEVILSADIRVPNKSKGWFVMPHTENLTQSQQWFENSLGKLGYGILCVNLLTEEEQKISENHLNLELLGERLTQVTNWLQDSEFFNSDPIIFLGHGINGAACLVAAFEGNSAWPLLSIVSIEGRPDLLRKFYLSNIKVPLLLIVGDSNSELISLNQLAENNLHNVKLLIAKSFNPKEPDKRSHDFVLKEIISWVDINLAGKNKYIPGEKVQHLPGY